MYHTTNFIGSSRSCRLHLSGVRRTCRYDVRQTAAVLRRESRANGPDLTYNEPSSDVFITKVKPDGTGFFYSGYIGGCSVAGTGPFAGDVAAGLAVDGAGNAYVSGTTRSDQGRSRSSSVPISPTTAVMSTSSWPRSLRLLDLQR